MTNRILFTGGGSAGHVTVNLALIPYFIKEGWEIDYIGSINGIEKELTESIQEVNYHSISTGKLRRYFDWNNIKDPFKVVKGVFQAYTIIKRRKPNVVFSKGGFVSVPVIIGAKLNKVPIITHESDLTPGLANKLSLPFTTKVCTTFPETRDHLPTHKVEHVGAIVRKEIFEGNPVQGRVITGFTKNKPTLLVVGGSLGSRRINEVVRASLDKLLPQFQIVHICGKGQVDKLINDRSYKQFEYVKEELPDLLSMADIVISRAGSNVIFELLALKKPMLLIPLTKEASRGDQLLNAKSFEDQGFSKVLFEEKLSKESLQAAIKNVYKDRHQYIEKMERSNNDNSIERVINLIKENMKK
ncbi:undecaprenyldiphospho-muramoylpentapeptide beta-N-acetylglucosaminyltransferase [Bacillus sp. SM2101]|uniref:undecaprenyldiphospho-muramoylpentapeptide beta-N-acetylglucosaminyltransferase n=1 Tax=Bacillus sp. SM2101 TaxID=2805366 RepID=UPI001BDF10FD|nr:undecaprenyldiphospho-muramoylpentapeptide beta-N-acetylglucosaminyltransferase [Bacillus sp. SM2101]